VTRGVWSRNERTNEQLVAYEDGVKSPVDGPLCVSREEEERGEGGRRGEGGDEAKGGEGR